MPASVAVLDDSDTGLAYRQVPPPPPLRRFVRCFWFLRSESGLPVQRIVPDGCPELVFDLGAPLMRGDGTASPSGAGARLVGQISGPLDLSSARPVDVVGVRFWGAALHRLFGLHAEQILDGSVALADVSADFADRLEDAVRSASTTADRADALARQMTRWVLAVEPSPSAVEHAVRAWHRSGGTLPVKRISEVVGLGTRQLERRFKAEVGLAPKRFARVIRFQRAFRALRQAPPGAGSAVAYRCGYADQSHLIRDCHAFAEVAPSRLAGDPAGALSERFARPLDEDSGPIT